MFDRRRAMLAVGVLIITATAGQVLQFGGAMAARFSASEDQAQGMPPMAVAEAAATPQLPADLPFSSVLPRPVALEPTIEVAALGARVEQALSEEPAVPHFPRQACDISVLAEPAADAMVRVGIDAPCLGGQRFTLRHAGLAFADRLDEDGSYKALIPALDADAPFAVSLAGGWQAEARVQGLALAGYERAAISWAGTPGLRLAASGDGPKQGGFVTELGNRDMPDPQLAVVFTLPPDEAVRLEAEVAIGPENCGTEIAGRALTLSGDGRIATTSLEVPIPECDGRGGFLLLKNLFQNTKIASN